AARMAGINGGAKTGTSEVGQNAETTNGWFVLLLATASYHLQCHCDSRTPLYGQIAAMCTTLP
ncbi:MAG: hypothetical protein HOY79_17285, partial [Streptomyces sp.]|nr:hypothetical protein [Streptomyces sp.]